MTKRVAWFTGEPSIKECFTPYKVYEIVREEDTNFSVINDEGIQNFCLKESCAHIKHGDWVFADVVEKEVKPVEAEQPAAVTKKPKKWGSWIKNKTGECPVGLKRKQKIKLKWTDGDEFVIDNPQDAAWYFSKGDNPVDITHYKMKLKDADSSLPPKSKWTKNTGVMPVDGNVKVELKRRDGDRGTLISGHCDWTLNDKCWNIIKWRLAK